MTLFVCGDVMTGRGIDQVLPHPSGPRIHESYMKSATGYVRLAERIHGRIPRPVGFDYVWGAALEELERLAPDVRIINLETAVTTSADYWSGKGIHYRMHPDNIPCITAANIDCCALANNHVLDWGHAGLVETLEVLERAGVEFAGAGRSFEEAERPAVLPVAEKGRVLVFSFGCATSGIPASWAASRDRAGVLLLERLDGRSVRRISQSVIAVKRPRDVVVASIHWGGNWGYGIPAEQARFARRLLEEAGVDVVHGHSSHHPKGIEVHAGKPIFYGCGDFINDYEGIAGYEEFRGELGLMYFLAVDPATGKLAELRMAPTRMRRFQVQRAAEDESRWLRATLSRECEKLGTRVEANDDGTLLLSWG